MAEAKIIHTTCHGCKKEMIFPAIPVSIVEFDGSVKTYWGKDDSVWICGECRQVPAKLKAARLAAGLNEKPNREGFEADEVDYGFKN